VAAHDLSKPLHDLSKPLGLRWKSDRMKIAKIVVVVVAAVGIFGLAIAGLLEFQNRTYASKVFANTVAYDKVLASRKWHNQTFGCTYAIVSLKEGSSHSPLDTWLRNEKWSKTPVRTNTNISICVQDGEVSSEVAARSLSHEPEPHLLA